jgi:hypothetical protein
MRSGLPHGTGCIRFENGDTSLGEFAARALHGKGSFYHIENLRIVLRPLSSSPFLVKTSRWNNNNGIVQM